MTFEARDSSGKVVPARYKLNTSTISSAARTANTNSTAMSCRHTSGDQIITSPLSDTNCIVPNYGILLITYNITNKSMLLYAT